MKRITQAAAPAVAHEDAAHAAAPQQPPADPKPDDPVEADLAELTRLILYSRSLQERITALGRDLRERGASWPRLARAAGISQQAAHQRWSMDGNRRHSEVQRRRTKQLRDRAAQASKEADQ